MKITKILVLLATCLAVSTPTIAAGTLPTVSYLKNTNNPGKNSDEVPAACWLRSDKSKKLILWEIYPTGRYRFNFDGKDIELKPPTVLFISDKGKVLTPEQLFDAEFTALKVFQHKGIKITLDYGKGADNEAPRVALFPSSKLILENQNTRQEILLTCVEGESDD